MDQQTDKSTALDKWPAAAQQQVQQQVQQQAQQQVQQAEKKKVKRTRIVVVLAVVLAVLLLAAFGGLLGDVLLYLLFLFLVGDPVLLFSAMCLYGKVKNERLRIILSAVTALVIVTLVWHSMVYDPPAGSEPSWFDYHPLV